MGEFSASKVMKEGYLSKGKLYSIHQYKLIKKQSAELVKPQ